MAQQDRETVKLTRECDAALVPQGTHVVIEAGAEVSITQSLGDSYTVYLKGYLLRIDGADADALGKEITRQFTGDADTSEKELEDLIQQRLKTCYDPEIPINIVDLGLIYQCEIRNLDNGTRAVVIEMTLTAPGCGMGDILATEIRDKIRQLHSVTQVEVELVFDPPWTQAMMSEAAKLQTGMI